MALEKPKQPATVQIGLMDYYQKGGLQPKARAHAGFCVKRRS
jgi:hypothetical protein